MIGKRDNKRRNKNETKGRKKGGVREEDSTRNIRVRMKA